MPSAISTRSSYGSRLLAEDPSTSIGAIAAEAE